MECSFCGNHHRRNTWFCANCNNPIEGGVVFVTGITGSNTGIYLQRLADEINNQGHAHLLQIHDVGHMMKEFAEKDDPNMKRDRILDADKLAIRRLRALALERIRSNIESKPTFLHIIDIHLSFRWSSYLTLGFETHIIDDFKPYTRCFINIFEDLAEIQKRLNGTSWATRRMWELLDWRNDEFTLTNICANFCGGVDYFLIPANEHVSTLERIIWHPDMKRIYLSFPITNILKDNDAFSEISQFRDELRKFATVFDPLSSKDFDDIDSIPEKQAIRAALSESIVQKDYRLIDQSDVVVVYYPRKVHSSGVEAEMSYAKRTGKPIYMYCPEDIGGGPFGISPSIFEKDTRSLIEFLRKDFVIS